jgi:hypothetical protein
MKPHKQPTLAFIFNVKGLFGSKKLKNTSNIIQKNLKNHKYHENLFLIEHKHFLEE